MKEDFEEPDKLKIMFSIQKRGREEKFKKRLEFCGEIDLGEFEGELVCQNMNINEMKGIAYSKIFEEIEKTLHRSKMFNPYVV